MPLGDHSTVFQAEMFVIILAVTELQDAGRQKVNLYIGSDSHKLP